jgi:hypothetical protein
MVKLMQYGRERHTVDVCVVIWRRELATRNNYGNLQ